MIFATVYAIVVLGGTVAVLIGVAMLIRRSERRLGPGTGGASAPTAPGASAQTDPIAAYLDRMTGELALPAADVTEVRAELADHLADSIAALEAEGLDRESAIREALGRLGPAAELGRQIRAAHQSTRRLLAGAGGGVFGAGGGFVVGYLAGGFIISALALGLYALGAGLAAVGLHLPDLLQDPHGLSRNTILIGLTWAIAAWAATRYAARTSASVSHRTPRAVAAVWAVAGGLLFGWWALFGLHGYQSWSVVAVELLIPVAAVGGAFVRIERGLPQARRIVVAVGLIALIVVPLGLGLFAMASTSTSSGSQTPQATSFQISDLHLDTVAPMAPPKWLGGGWAFRTGLDGFVKNSDGFEMVASLYSTETQTEPTLALGPALAKWKDVRFEAWHALPMEAPGPGGIDTGYSSPFATRPAIIEGNSLRALFDFEHMRDAQTWWVVLTGIGPDGHRYRLDEFGYGDYTDFNGSAWDWLTAPQ